MANNLPYFKFEVTEWMAGEIVLQDFETQGMFINICAFYWKEKGQITVEDVIRRYKNNELFLKLTPRFISVFEGVLSIAFLDEQLTSQNYISLVNTKNGSLGGRPKTKEIKPNAKRSKSDTKPKLTNIEEEEEREEDIKLEKEEEIERRKINFASTLEPYLSIYGRDMLNNFYSYWAEPNKSKSKFRQEMEKTWEIERRLSTWASRENNFKSEKKEEKKSIAKVESLQNLNGRIKIIQ